MTPIWPLLPVETGSWIFQKIISHEPQEIFSQYLHHLKDLSLYYISYTDRTLIWPLLPVENGSFLYVYEQPISCVHAETCMRYYVHFVQPISCTCTYTDFVHINQIVFHKVYKAFLMLLLVCFTQSSYTCLIQRTPMEISSRGFLGYPLYYQHEFFCFLSLYSWRDVFWNV